MKRKTFTERELLEGLDAEAAHADELAQLLMHELTPLERLKGSVIRYERPLDSVWDECFGSDEEGDRKSKDDHSLAPRKE